MESRGEGMAGSALESSRVCSSLGSGWKQNVSWFFARRWVAPALGIAALLMAVLPQALGAIVKSHVLIGWDTQDYKCLPFTIYLFKKADGRDSSGWTGPSLRRGEMVTFRAHDGNTGLPHLDGVRMVKIVAGLPGDKLVVKDDFAFINGAPWGRLTLMDTLHMRPGSLDREVIVPSGKVLLLGTTPYSYDGRYYGFIDQGDVDAMAIPVF